MSPPPWSHFLVVVGACDNNYNTVLYHHSTTVLLSTPDVLSMFLYGDKKLHTICLWLHYDYVRAMVEGALCSQGMTGDLVWERLSTSCFLLQYFNMRIRHEQPALWVVKTYPTCFLVAVALGQNHVVRVLVRGRMNIMLCREEQKQRMIDHDWQAKCTPQHWNNQKWYGTVRGDKSKAGGRQ